MKGMKPVLVGVGHCCQDIVCTVEAYPPEDGSTHITAIDDSQGGGAVATALVAAARLGVPSAVLANLGDDSTGRRMEADFRQYGVDTSGIRFVPGGRSSTSYVMIDPRHGTRTKFPYRDNLPALSFTQADEAAIREAKALHLDGTHYENALAAAEIAKRHSVTISLDGCSMAPDHALNRRLASMADILIMNARYPRLVSGEDTLEDALRFFASQGAKIVASTAGADGCYAWLDGGMRHIPAFPVQAVDTTGAGDVFHGAFLAAWLKGKPAEACFAFAAAAAALKCSRYGGRRAIPDSGEAEAFLQSHGALTGC